MPYRRTPHPRKRVFFERARTKPSGEITATRSRKRRVRFAPSVTNETQRTRLYAKSVLEHAAWPIAQAVFGFPQAASQRKRLATTVVKSYRFMRWRYEAWKEQTDDLSIFEIFEGVYGSIPPKQLELLFPIP